MSFNIPSTLALLASRLAVVLVGRHAVLERAAERVAEFHAAVAFVVAHSMSKLLKVLLPKRIVRAMPLVGAALVPSLGALTHLSSGLLRVAQLAPRWQVAIRAELRVFELFVQFFHH